AVIGIQIRFHDDVMIGRRACDSAENMDFARQYLDCGQQLQAQLHKHHNVTAKLFLITNCMPVKVAWVADMGNGIITDNSFRPRHTLRLHDDETQELRNTISDMWQYGLCDLFVRAEGSQFGKTGALLSLSLYSTWLLQSWDPKPRPEAPKCTLDNYTPFSVLATQHVDY
ncbi:hypothetical protein SARC_11556, partial [Sphaeroforma arctica JP610]